MDVGENRLIYMGLFENEVPSISIKIAISYGLLTMVYHIFGKTCIVGWVPKSMISFLGS